MSYSIPDNPNDPTHSGSPMPAGDGAMLSCNEVEMLCLKAARGAGFSWGLAEEAGFAAGWLAAHGLDGAAPVLARLRRADGRNPPSASLTFAPGVWSANPDARLCPITVGAALCDFAALPEAAMADGGLVIDPLCHPVLLLPFLSHVARVQGQAIVLVAGGCRGAVTAAGQLCGDIAGLVALDECAVELSHGPGAVPPADADCHPVTVPRDVLQGLNSYAMRITVPASDMSRSGAGAAADDND